MPNPPVVEAIAEDPLLADTKIIAEAWDAAGAYQVGTFGSLRWAEWNGRYRDDVRRFWRGDPHMVGPLATRLAGSSDLYQAERPPAVPQHQLHHLARRLHAERPGQLQREAQRGQRRRRTATATTTTTATTTASKARRAASRSRRVRLRQIKNMLATLLLSQGVPMLLAGDECRRTQQGNNNAYCQDNDISWFDWKLVEQERELAALLPGADRLPQGRADGAADRLPHRPAASGPAACPT